MTPGHMLLATLAGLGALAAARQQVRDARAAAWAERVAEALPEAELADDAHDGVRIRLDGETAAARLEVQITPLVPGVTVLEMRVPAPMPPELLLRSGGAPLLGRDDAIRVGVPEVDAHFHVSGRDPVWVGATLSPPPVVRQLRWIRQHLGSVGIAGGVVRVVAGWPVSPGNLLPIVRRVVDLGVALSRASVSAWWDAGLEHDLKLRVAGALAMRLESGDGRVALRFATRNVGVMGTQVLRVRIAGFPEDVTLVARRPADPAGPGLGDLILDRGVRASGPTDGLGARLAADAVRGPLLDFLHGEDQPRVVKGCLELRTVCGSRPVLLKRLASLQALAEAMAGPA